VCTPEEMAGDPAAHGQLAAALVGADSTDEADLRARIAAVWEPDAVHQADDMMGVATDDLLSAVRAALAAARPD